MTKVLRLGLLAAVVLGGFAFPVFAQPATQEVSIIARRFEFIPNTITVQKGVPVRLYLTALDTTHGFYLDAFKINVNIPKGELTVVDFVPDKAGTFDFQCSVFCGIGHLGMKGKLVVVEKMASMMMKPASMPAPMMKNMPMHDMGY